MDDYIRRGAAIEETCSDCTERNICGGSCSDTDRLRAIPTADVVEVRYGRWNDVYLSGASSFVGTCSVCGKSNDIPPVPLAKYCPNCGAKMDGGEK